MTDWLIQMWHKVTGHVRETLHLPESFSARIDNLEAKIKKMRKERAEVKVGPTDWFSLHHASIESLPNLTFCSSQMGDIPSLTEMRRNRHSPLQDQMEAICMKAESRLSSGNKRAAIAHYKALEELVASSSDKSSCEGLLESLSHVINNS